MHRRKSNESVPKRSTLKPKVSKSQALLSFCPQHLCIVILMYTNTDAKYAKTLFAWICCRLLVIAGYFLFLCLIPFYTSANSTRQCTDDVLYVKSILAPTNHADEPE